MPRPNHTGAPMTEEWLLCPDCGWTGSESDLEWSDAAVECPVCETEIRRR